MNFLGGRLRDEPHRRCIARVGLDGECEPGPTHHTGSRVGRLDRCSLRVGRKQMNYYDIPQILAACLMTSPTLIPFT